MSLLVASATNQRDGQTVAVVLDGSPAGTLGFIAAREPSATDPTAITVAYSGTGPYLIVLPFPELWYIFATDATVPSVNFQAVWVGTSDGDFFDEVGVALRDLLIRHRPGIEARLQLGGVPTTVKQIVYGSASGIESWPSIVVTRPSYHSKWYAMPNVKLYSLRLGIAVVLAHEDEQTQVPLVAKAVEAVVLILSRHEQINLPGGAQLYACQAESGEVSEQQLDGTAHWLTLGPLQWTCTTLRQEDT